MYQALLITPTADDYVVDYEGETINEVENKLAERGSQWCFYPFEVIIKDNYKIDFFKQRVIRAYGELEWLQGKSIKTLLSFIKEYGIEILTY